MNDDSMLNANDGDRGHAARREFLRLASCALLAPIVLSTSSGASANAPKLSESDPTASSLGYRQDASKVDTSKYPKRTPEQSCANCKLSKAGADGEWIPCTLYAGKLVSTKGWCAAWAKREA